MSDEIEAKFAVRSLRAVARAVRAAGGQYLGTFLQTDRFYDTPDQRLRRADSAVRIRRVRVLRGSGVDKDTRPLVTFKGPRRDHPRMKVREEIQTPVDDAEALVRILEAGGLKPMMVVQKRRASYRLGECLIELDELPLIGRFVEIEGPGERAICDLAGNLGIDGEPITQSYLSLVEDRCRKVLACGGATFDRCAECPDRPEQ